jgi:site-specific DNA recombinase
VDIYVRVSQVNGRDVEADGGTADQQKKQCRAQLVADGLTEGQTFIDLDESGGKASRPAFDQMMERISTGKSGGVIVKNLRRFGRSQRHVLDALDVIEDAGAVFISCEDKFDTSTPMGRFARDLMIRLGQLELEERTEGWDRSRGGAIARGIVIGPAPAGYTKPGKGQKLVPNEHAPAIRRAFELRADGASWKVIAQHLTDAGVPAHTGSSVWSLKGASTVIDNEAYLGVARHGTHRNAGAHEPIVTQDIWNRCQARKGSYAPRSDTGPKLLTGLLTCGSCGGKLAHGVVGGKYGYYRCTNRGKCPAPVGIVASKAEGYIVQQALPHLRDFVLKATAAAKDAEPVDANLEGALEEAEAEVAAFVVNVPAATPGFVEGLQRRQDEVARLRLQIAQANTPTTDDVIAQLASLADEDGVVTLTGSFDDTRRMFATLLKKATVARGRSTNEPVENRITLEWNTPVAA